MTLEKRWKAEQLRWAAEYGCSHDQKGYVGSVNVNLFRPMLVSTEAEYRRGSGGEMGANTSCRQPKMHALHSSSALACNVFDYWRSEGVAPIGKAMKMSERVTRIEFEAQFPTGLPGSPPNLDVAVRVETGRVWGVESKFTEPFGSSKVRQRFKEKYFPSNGPVWANFDLAGCAVLASRIQTGDLTFRHLDAAQLLKHALGLQVQHKGQFTLCYLYVDSDCVEGSVHRQEIARFADGVSADFPFVPLSYARFIQELRRGATGNHDAYFEYIGKRYPVGAALCECVSAGP